MEITLAKLQALLDSPYVSDADKSALRRAVNDWRPSLATDSQLKGVVASAQTAVNQNSVRPPGTPISSDQSGAFSDHALVQAAMQAAGVQSTAALVGQGITALQGFRAAGFTDAQIQRRLTTGYTGQLTADEAGVVPASGGLPPVIKDDTLGTNEYREQVGFTNDGQMILSDGSGGWYSGTTRLSLDNPEQARLIREASQNGSGGPQAGSGTQAAGFDTGPAQSRLLGLQGDYLSRQMSGGPVTFDDYLAQSGQQFAQGAEFDEANRQFQEQARLQASQQNINRDLGILNTGVQSQLGLGRLQLDADSLANSQYEFGQNLGESQRQFNINTTEGQRQFNDSLTEQAAQARAFEARQRAGLEEQGRQFGVTEGRLLQDSAVNATSQLSAVNLANQKHIAEILRNPTDYVARAFAQRGGDSPTAEVTQADLINQLQAELNRIAQTAGGMAPNGSIDPNAGRFQASSLDEMADLQLTQAVDAFMTKNPPGTPPTINDVPPAMDPEAFYNKWTSSITRAQNPGAVPDYDIPGIAAPPALPALAPPAPTGDLGEVPTPAASGPPAGGGGPYLPAPPGAGGGGFSDAGAYDDPFGEVNGGPLVSQLYPSPVYTPQANQDDPFSQSGPNRTSLGLPSYTEYDDPFGEVNGGRGSSQPTVSLNTGSSSYIPENIADMPAFIQAALGYTAPARTVFQPQADQDDPFSYAQGGHTNRPQFLVGDAPGGRLTPNTEMILNPTNAPIGVVPRDRLPAQSRLVKGFNEGTIGTLDDQIRSYSPPAMGAETEAKIGTLNINQAPPPPPAQQQESTIGPDGTNAIANMISSLNGPTDLTQGRIQNLEQQFRPPAVNDVVQGRHPGELNLNLEGRLASPQALNKLTQNDVEAFRTSLATRNMTLEDYLQVVRQRFGGTRERARGRLLPQ